MEDAPIVTVRGEALLEVEPELAHLTVSMRATDRERDKTLDALDRRTQAFNKLMESFGEAIDRFETASVYISPLFKDGGRPRERISGYSATIRHTIYVSDFTKLGDLVVRLAEQESTDVGGPWWSLRRDTDVYRQARIQAAREAVQRASEYAEAVGSTVVGLIELADTGLLSEGARPAQAFGPPPAPMAASGYMSGGAPPPREISLQLEPARQAVRAGVEARFRLSPASLGR